MVNIVIPLPNHLHSNQGARANIEFELRKTYYSINGEEYKIDLCKYGNVLYWTAAALKQNLLVTLYYEKDIIK